MKTLFCLLPYLALALTALSPSRGAETVSASEKNAVITAVTAADDERLAAMKAADAARLDAIFSEELRYAHSNGVVDSKSTFITALTSGKSVYENFEYKDRTILPAGPGIAVMSGRVLVRIRNGDQKVGMDLNYLSVWREENGKWRFLAWQSCRNTPPTTAPGLAK
jgi:hypothetical protein